MNQLTISLLLLMSLWSRMFGREPPVEREPSPSAPWIPADKNRFGIPILDLISVTGNLLSASKDRQQAATALSWSSTPVTDLALDVKEMESLACDLRYVAEQDLPDGWLFTPSAMEEKWAIGYRDNSIYMIRSWTGAVSAIGRTRRDGDTLIVERLELADDALRVFGDPIETFDWILRAHALQEVVPLPVASGGASMLEAVPLSVFSLFGKVAVYAATSWSPTPQSRPLRSKR